MVRVLVFVLVLRYAFLVLVLLEQ